jgi:glucokinase
VNDLKYILGVDIGGTKCAVTLGCIGNSSHESKEDGSSGGISFVDKVSFSTETAKGVDHTLEKLLGSMDGILAGNGKKPEDIWSIGISCGGPLDSKRGVIMSPPNLPGWDDIHIVELFEKHFGIRTRLQNDANACALAEWKFGAARGFNNIIFLTFGTGMGAGLILDGRLYSGTSDMAGEVGHMRLADIGPVGFGKAGSFEGFCSGGGIAQLARLKVIEKLQMGEKVSFCEGFDKLMDINAKIVGDAAEAGDELAKEIYRISGEHLGQGLSLLIDILNPEVIVIGSIFARSANLLWPAAKDVIGRESLIHSRKVCRVVPAGLGDSIGDYAALAVAVIE